LIKIIYCRASALLRPINSLARFALLTACLGLILFARVRKGSSGKEYDRLQRRLNELTRENQQLREQILEHEQTEKQIVGERNLLRTLIDIFPDLIYAKDRESRFILVNRAMLKRSGLSEFHQLLGKTDLDLFPPETAEQYHADDREVMQTGEMLVGKEEAAQPFDGEPVWMMTTKVPLQDAADEIVGTMGISRDITERKQAEIALQEAHAELERERAQILTIMDAMTEGVVGVIFDEHRIPVRRYVNRAFTELMGFNADEWDVNRLRRAKATESEITNVVQSYTEAMEDTGLWQAELRLMRQDGTEFEAAVTANRVNDPDGKMIGVVTVIRDISQEKMLDEKRSRFVANASHELRTPITNLLTRLYLLKRQPERMTEHVQVLENVSTRMRNLVEDLLEYSRFERGVIPLKPRVLDLCLIVTDVIQIQEEEAAKKQVRIAHPAHPESVRVMADPERITQVFTNLITNAINYTPESGLVEVDIKIEKKAEFKNPVVAVSVRDTGIGIAPELLPHIFEPFYRGSEHTKGTGLGLSITREIVRMHGGSISVESIQGAGSTFTVRLTLVDVMV
jgi:PAS domain S-box-containing protein